MADRKRLTLSRHAISACHVTRQRQMELDSVMVFRRVALSGERQVCEQCAVTSATQTVPINAGV